ncbi:ATP-binding protein [Methanogenium organophilum]|uniref:ATP-binding protein n=1 Tax=Methanogenium organophilum TaxID=2199 RepID=A0A9X9S2Q9_METOG|nr:ATP-binding protein [Methanogenium organophilum]WAI00707.1 ATP-binding protein [Methanogenium organophilum]
MKVIHEKMPHYISVMDIIVGKANGRDFGINAQELVTGRTCIIAQSGAGKSWTIAVLCEQLCRYHIGFCLIDTEGEYFSLKDRFDLTWIGADDECDYDIERVEGLKEIIRDSINTGIPVIYDVSEVEMTEKVSRLADILYDLATEERKPYLMIVEEADKFIPQSRDSIKKIEEISRRGRKRGLGLMVATQRPAIVTKNVLSQCNNQIIGKLSIENDLKAVDLFFGSKREVEELSSLNPGDFYIMGGLTREKTRMRFGKRETKHRGLTPILAPRSPDPVQNYVDEAPEAPEPAELQDTPESPVETAQDAPNNQETQPGKGGAAKKKPVVTPVSSERKEKKEEKEKKPKPHTRVRRKKTPSPLEERALPLRIERDEALNIAGGRKKKVLIFGKNERLVSAALVYWPLCLFHVRYISGKIRKITQDTSFIIDATQGRCADISDGLRFRACFSDYIGLSEDAIRVLNSFSISGETAAEIEAQTRLSPEVVEDAISELSTKKLITASQMAGEREVWVPLVRHGMPRLGTGMVRLPAALESLDGGTVLERMVHEQDIRTILKVTQPTAEIIACQLFSCPVYEVKIASPAGERTVYIDGFMGKNVLVAR